MQIRLTKPLKFIFTLSKKSIYEIDLLHHHMFTESGQRLRITASSAQRQIAWHYPELTNDVIKSLLIGYRHEAADEVIKWIIVMIGTVPVKNLGSREDRENPDLIHGDLQKAKVKTDLYLKKLFGDTIG